MNSRICSRVALLGIVAVASHMACESWADAGELVYVSRRNEAVVRAYALDLQSFTNFVDLSADPAYDGVEFKGIGFDGSSNFYAVDGVNSKVIKFNSSGQVTNNAFITGLTDAGYLDVAANGDMLIVDNGLASGSRVSKWTAANSTLTPNFITGLSSPVSAIFADDGNVLVSSNSTNKVAKCNGSNGAVINLDFIAPTNMGQVDGIIRSGGAYLVSGYDTNFDAVIYSFPLTGGTAGSVRVGLQTSGPQPTAGSTTFPRARKRFCRTMRAGVS